MRKVLLIIAGILAMMMPAQALANSTHQESAEANYRILPAGDSVTLGIGSSGTNFLNSWRNFLRTGGFNWLDPDYVGICPNTDPAWKCIGTPTMSDKNHSGSSGWRSDEIALRMPWYMDWYDPQTVTLLAGANDIAYPGGYDLANYANRMGGIVDTILSKRPATHIFVMTMTQFRDQRPIVNQLNNQLVVEMATKGPYVHIVPTHIVGDEPDIELYDHVHPNNCGYERMAYVLYQYMEPVYSPGLNWPAIPNPFYTTTANCP